VISVVPYNYERLIELCRFYQREYVLVDYQDEGDIRDVPSVEADNRQSIMGVMRHLFDLGHRRIGFITGDLKMISARQRLQGYKDALKATGIRYDPALVGTGDWLHTRAYTVAKALLQLNPPPTAIVGSNDFSAFGAMQAAHQLGLEVGRDVSITGFDDIRMASTVTPALTTVRQPMYVMGVTAVEMLIKRMNGEPIPNLHVRLPTTLVIRESTGQVEP
jgi:LacI family transcriptional regulator